MKYATMKSIYEQDAKQNEILKSKKHIFNIVQNLHVELQGIKNYFSQQKDPPLHQNSAHGSASL